MYTTCKHRRLTIAWSGWSFNENDITTKQSLKLPNFIKIHEEMSLCHFMCQKKNPSTADTGRWGLSSPIGRETSLEFLEIQSNHHWVKSFILVLVAFRKEGKKNTDTGKYLCRIWKYYKSYIFCKLYNY